MKNYNGSQHKHIVPILQSFRRFHSFFGILDRITGWARNFRNPVARDHPPEKIGGTFAEWKVASDAISVYMMLPMKDYKEIESVVIAELDKTTMEFSVVTGGLRSLIAANRHETALSLAGLASERLIKEDRLDDLLNHLTVVASLMTAGQVLNVLTRMMGTNPEGRIFLKNSGLEGNVSPLEAVRRIQTLRVLKPGVLCQDKTWGFGEISDLDLFYERVIIHFEKKRDHEFSLAYAAETLTVLPEDHMRVRKHRDPAAMREMIEKNPAEIVRLALISYGSMSAVVLQETLSPSIVPEAGWKKFWDAARKALKDDPMVDLPAKRTEPIALRSKAKAYDDHWAESLLKNRNMPAILDMIEEWVTAGDAAQDDVLVNAVKDRLAFVVKGAGHRHPVITARAMMLAAQAGIEEHGDLSVPRYIEYIFEGRHMADVLDALGARDQKMLMQFLLERKRDQSLDTLLRELSEFSFTMLSEAIQLLIREGREDSLATTIRRIVQSRAPQVELLYWLSRNMDRLVTWKLCRPLEFAEMVLLELEKEQNGTRLKTQNQLRERFVQRDWLHAALGEITQESRNIYFQKVKDSPSWPPMEKRSVLGHMIKTFPELEALMMARSDDDPPRQRGPMTSSRTYLERQRQLEKIKLVDIPQNSKDIGHARSYGDLRENFEFKAAKEMQGILMRRQAELEQMLSLVSPTDFDGFPHDEAGIATGVLLEYASGRQEQYYILGVWDRDEALGIISCESKMALALTGRKPGEKTVVPTEQGEEECLVKKVTPLPDPVQEWIKSEPPLPPEAKTY